jgi:hypothetical protein
MPPFDKIDASKHTRHRSWKRNSTEEQWRLCVEQPHVIMKTRSRNELGLSRLFMTLWREFCSRREGSKKSRLGRHRGYPYLMLLPAWQKLVRTGFTVALALRGREPAGTSD